MTNSAIIKELRSIEAETSVYADGLKKLRERSYLLRRKLEGALSPSASKAEAQTLEEIKVKTSLRYKKKLAKKIAK